MIRVRSEPIKIGQWVGVLIVTFSTLAGLAACTPVPEPEPIDCVWWHPDGPDREARIHCPIDNMDSSLVSKVNTFVEIEAKREAGVSKSEIRREYGEPKTYAPVHVMLEPSANRRSIIAWLKRNAVPYYADDWGSEDVLDANVEFIKLLELSQIDGVAYIRRKIENADLVNVPSPPTNTPRPTWGIAPRPTATIAPTAPPPTHPIVLGPSPTPVPDPFSYVPITILHLPEDEESISSLIEFLADNGSTDIERSEPFVTSAQVTFRMVRRLARHPEYESTFIFGLYSDKMEVAIDWNLTKYVAGIITAAEAAEEIQGEPPDSNFPDYISDLQVYIDPPSSRDTVRDFILETWQGHIHEEQPLSDARINFGIYVQAFPDLYTMPSVKWIQASTFTGAVTEPYQGDDR